MVWASLWVAVWTAVRIAAWSRFRSSVYGAGAQASGGSAPGTCAPPADGRKKRFYSLMIEVRPKEADAETLQLFSDFGASQPGSHAQPARRLRTPALHGNVAGVGRGAD